jgi:acid stress-induced BolA-like protein IbaG/YrbA
MVLPKKIDEKNYQNGEYYLKKEEKMIIASLKKVLEDNKLKTIGFESVIKNISERRLLQSGTKVDLKTLILESNEADFYVEFENLDDGVMLNQNNGNCPKSFDFKIRNYATGEDIASDLQEINTCGSIDEYKKFANKILNNGAITKINDEFQYLVENGKKISIFFSFSNSSNKKFDDKIQGLRISQHIEKCIKENAFNGKFIFGGVVNNYISFPQVSVPFIDKNNNQLYTVPQFSNAIRDYLENYLEVREVTVTGSSINFILN